VPSPKDHFGIFNEPFQWLDLSKIETLVSQKYQKYQKHQSRNLQIRLEGEKIGFSQIQTHQETRLSQVHLLVSSVFYFEHFHFSVIFLAPGKDVCKH
jgi:hypothetical protein